MDTGRNTKEVVDAAYREALIMLVATLRQHRSFFANKRADYHVRLLLLARCCRRYLRRGVPELARDMVASELFYLFGVRVDVPTSRHLSLIAAVLRFTLIDGALADQVLISRGGVNVLIEFLNRELAGLAGTVGKATAISLPLLDSLLVQLAQHDREATTVLELHYFAALSARDIRLELGGDIDVVSVLGRSKAWLLNQLRITMTGRIP